MESLLQSKRRASRAVWLHGPAAWVPGARGRAGRGAKGHILDAYRHPPTRGAGKGARGHRAQDGTLSSPLLPAWWGEQHALRPA